MTSMSFLGPSPLGGVLLIVWLKQKVFGVSYQNTRVPWEVATIQSLVDGIKLILKEDIVPTGSDPWLFLVLCTHIYLRQMYAEQGMSTSKDFSSNIESPKTPFKEQKDGSLMPKLYKP